MKYYKKNEAQILEYLYTDGNLCILFPNRIKDLQNTRMSFRIMYIIVTFLFNVYLKKHRLKKPTITNSNYPSSVLV